MQRRAKNKIIEAYKKAGSWAGAGRLLSGPGPGERISGALANLIGRGLRPASPRVLRIIGEVRRRPPPPPDWHRKFLELQREHEALIEWAKSRGWEEGNG